MTSTSFIELKKDIWANRRDFSYLSIFSAKRCRLARTHVTKPGLNFHRGKSASTSNTKPEPPTLGEYAGKSPNPIIPEVTDP
jgi:hypothetical protein